MEIIFVDIFIPVIAGLVYFIMAWKMLKVNQIRKLIFGELAYKKMFYAFLMLGIYFISRPLQMIAPHPWPMIANCARQFFLMAVIAPSVLVGIFHWVPDEKGTPESAVFASYGVGLCTAVIFILINSIAIQGSKIVGTFAGFNFYDAVWFSGNDRFMRLVIIHLIAQLISPVGFFMLAAAYVRHRRYNHTFTSVYTNLKKKWKLIELGLIVFVISLLISGLAALFGSYYTYLWVIYFLAAIFAGLIELKGMMLPLVDTPQDLRSAD